VIDMTDDALEEFLAEDPGGPVIMLNLLRYVPDTGRADYLAYIAHTQTISGRYGTEPLFWGDGRTPLVADDEQVWDSVLLVRYPSKQAFAEMMGDPAHLTGAHLRTRALVAAVLQPTDQRLARPTPAGPGEGNP
jgi:uncharacterized protein (DUF1330 family)